MPVPSQSDMFRVTLGTMLDGKQHRNKEVKSIVLEGLSLSSDEKEETTSSGVEVWDSRVGWAISYLERAGMIKRINRGVYEITDLGRKTYDSGADGSEMVALLNKLINEHNPWNKTDKKQGKKPVTPTPSMPVDGPASVNTKSPNERIDEAASELDESLSSELLQMIMERDPAFFEKLVVDLIERMGYGRGKVTQHSNDGGIDGMVTTDELGFRPIYTQAKRYAADHKIGRQTVQAFFGALGSVGSGVFITTSSFTKEALDAARLYPHATVVLIDGKRLTDLMIKYDLGVTVERVVKVKRVDLDYFEE